MNMTTTAISAIKAMDDIVGLGLSFVKERKDGRSIKSKMAFRKKVSQGMEFSHVRGPKQPQLVIPRAVIPYK